MIIGQCTPVVSFELKLTQLVMYAPTVSKVFSYSVWDGLTWTAIAVRNKKRNQMSKSGKRNLTDEVPVARKKTNTRVVIGCLLILLSGVFFFSMLSVPWLQIDSRHKVILGGALFVGVQVAWWLGAALVGPAAIGAMFSWFRRS